MNRARRIVLILREAAITALAQPVSSIVSIVIVAGMCASVLLTTGRTVGAEDAVLSSIDSAGTRSIIVRAEPEAGLNSLVLDRLTHLSGIESAIAFGAAIDTQNAGIADGISVPLRAVWSTDQKNLGIPADGIVNGATAWASSQALDQLGMLGAAGGVVTNEGRDYAVVGRLTVPEYLHFLEPMMLVPQTEEVEAPVSVLVVTTEQPALVAPVAKAVRSLLAVDDPSKVTINTSEAFVTLRALVEGQLGSFGRELVLVIFGIIAIFVASILYGFTMLRRKDYGRRRALGASRTLIFILVLAQMLILALIGATLGLAAAVAALVSTADPVPPMDFIGAVAVLTCAVTVIAATVPALVAARRDPIRELRVP